MFELYSYRLVSVEMIAEQAGVRRTTFYGHFEGKIQVVPALFDKMAPDVRGYWKDILNDSDPRLRQCWRGPPAWGKLPKRIAALYRVAADRRDGG